MVVAALTAIALQFPAERGLGDIYGLTYLFSAHFFVGVRKKLCIFAPELGGYIFSQHKIT